MTLASTPISATGASVAIHGVVLVVVLAAFAAPAQLEGIGTDVQIALAPDLGDDLDADTEENLATPLPPLEPPMLEPIPEPVFPEMAPLEELPLPEDDELLPEVVEVVEVPDFSISMVKVPPQRQTPTPVEPPAVPARVEAPRTKPTPQRRATVQAKRSAGRRGGSTNRARLVPVHRPHHFPAHAQSMGITGSVRVEMLIAPSGEVVKVRVFRSSGHSMLDEAALASARQWRFSPPGEYRRARQSFSFRMR